MRDRVVTLEMYTTPPHNKSQLATVLDMFESIWLQRYLTRFESGPVYLKFDWTYRGTFRKHVRFSHSTILWTKIARALWERGVVIGREAWFECGGAVYHYDGEPHVVFTLKGEA